MTGLNYVTRRGAIYVWQRRLPARVSRTSYIQISLRTARFSTAKILANLVNAGFEACSDRMKSKRITKEEAQRFLVDLVARNLEQIEEERYYEPDAPTPEEWRSPYFAEKCRAAAYRFLASRVSAAELLPEDELDLKREGFSMDHLAQIRIEIAALRRQMASEAFRSESRVLAAEALDRPGCKDMDLWAVGSLRMAAQAEALERCDRRKAVTAYLNLDLDDLPALLSSPQPEQSAASRYSDAMADLIRDHIDGRNRQVEDVAERKKITKDVKQRRSVLEHFAEVVGVATLSQLRQEDLFHYVSVLERLPKIYRKTPEDQARSLEEILERAEELPSRDVGLSPATINRNLTILQGFLKFARSRGAKPAEVLDISELRRASDEDARSARLAFSEADMADLAAHSVWTGCSSISRRCEPGQQVIKDGLFWGPILASLTGARREEIMGLRLDDMDLDHKVPHIHIRKNANRRLKNASSDRFVPLHSTLRGLGFDNYVRDMRSAGEVDLFPELRPTRDTGSFGDVFYRKWKPVVTGQLNDRATRRTFHSFRHRFITVLRHNSDVPKEVVQDLVGHSHQDQTDGRYRKTADYRDQILAKMQAVIEQVPAHVWLPRQ